MSSSQTNYLTFWVKVKKKNSRELRNEMGKPYDFELKDHCHFMNKSQFAYQINLKCTYSLEMGFSFFIYISILHFFVGRSFLHFYILFEGRCIPILYICNTCSFTSKIISYNFSMKKISKNFVLYNHSTN